MRQLSMLIMVVAFTNQLKAENSLWCKRGHLNLDQAELIKCLAGYVAPNFVLETGFCTGRSASVILSSSSPERFISVDIDLDYLAPEGRQYADLLQKRYQCFRVIESSAKSTLTSNFFKMRYPNGLDWVTIDGDHSYDGCFFDLITCAPYLNSNGVMIIDDYRSGPPNGCCLPDVTNAVNDFLARHAGFHMKRWYCLGKGIAIIARDKNMLEAFVKEYPDNIVD